MDCTTDSSHADQLSIIIRYLNRSLDIFERLLSVQRVKESSAEGLFNTLQEILKESSLSLKDAVGQSYDGASVMTGNYKGEQLENLPPLCKNIAGGWTQNAISIIFAKYRLVSEVLGIWFLRRAISNFVHNFLLISVKDWYSCQLLIFWSDDIVCWSKFPNFDMWVGCQKLSAILNLRLIEY